jgi:hypothetical protein
MGGCVFPILTETKLDNTTPEILFFGVIKNFCSEEKTIMYLIIQSPHRNNPGTVFIDKYVTYSAKLQPQEEKQFSVSVPKSEFDEKKVFQASWKIKVATD